MIDEFKIKSEIEGLGDIKVMYDKTRVHLTRDNPAYGENEGIVLAFLEVKQIFEKIVEYVTKEINEKGFFQKDEVQGERQ